MKKRVLVVDDEPRMRRFVRMNLELENYEVSEADNGLDALNKVREELPDLEIEDLVYAENIGAYSNASATWFNGFPPAKVVHLNL